MRNHVIKLVHYRREPVHIEITCHVQTRLVACFVGLAESYIYTQTTNKRPLGYDYAFTVVFVATFFILSTFTQRFFLNPTCTAISLTINNNPSQAVDV